MGALHRGHLALIESAIQQNPIIVVSIFVNPTQFNDARDFQKYPRNFENDVSILRPILRAGDIIFLPDEAEMYPEPDTRRFHFGGLEQTMEGLYRPGHFNGVAQIVSTLFELVHPDRAYFGQKDFQQLRIIQELVDRLDLPVEIVACPTVRENDGLAMSSRNALLRSDVRQDASRIYASLERAAKLSSQLPVKEVKKATIEYIHQSPLLEVEYFEIVKGSDLRSIHSWKEEGAVYGCIAVQAGGIRLIDNIRFK
jgi:pantoate--beta-alanine ligase